MIARPRDPFGALTVIVSIAVLVFAVAFLTMRAVLPSEPAVVSTDDWPWSGAGVAVQPAGDRGPFEAGDVVVSMGERPVADWAQSLGAGGRHRLPGSMTIDVLRHGEQVRLNVALDPPSIFALLAHGLGLLAFTIAQLVVAYLAWKRRSQEGWRRGFLVGSVANLASAVTWELGLQPTDLVRPEPMFLLFTFTGPLHLLFWSSVVHVIASFPTRSDVFANRPWLVAALYGLPQLCLPIGIAIARANSPSTLGWFATWSAVLAWIVLVMLALTTVATVSAYRRWPVATRRQILPLAVGIVATALAVLGLTVLPILTQGRPLASRNAVAVLGLPAVSLLIVAVLRYRLFEIRVLDASRRRLIIAREEERRRIRRDLHDGLGPALAAMALKLDVARDQVRSDPDATDAMLAELKADAQAAVADIRRLVRDLRPPALDELGLVEAVRQRATEFGAGRDGEANGGGGLEVLVEGPAALPTLNAAVEVAAYRIAVEALTNVVRHAKASRCIVRISTDRELELQVLDDGLGIDPDRPAGVGLTSMRERTAELGGSLTIDRSAEGWTRIVARLPLRFQA